MSDTTTSVPDANGTPTPTPEVTLKEIPNATELTNSLAAARRREGEATKALEETNKRLAALEAEKVEREQAEMSELDKAKADLEAKNAEIEQLGGYKTKYEEYEASLKEQVLKDIEGYSEEDQALVLALPLSKQPAMIKRLNSESPAAETAGAAGPKTGVKKVAEIWAMPPGPERDAAYAEYRKTVRK